MKKTITLFALMLTCFGMTAQPAGNGTPRPPRPRFYFDGADPGVHDPVMAKEGDTYYIFSTGVQEMTSTDLKNWTMEKAPAVNFDWIKKYVPRHFGGAWAPDIIYHQGKWHLFCSPSAFGINTSVICHLTRSTLDPESPEEWKDCGEIIHSTRSNNWNAIDANVVVDDKGTPWMDFGSFWDGIQLVKLKKDMSATAGKPRTIARRYAEKRPDIVNPTSNHAGTNAIEAPFIYKHDGWYYLFVSWDYCCRGDQSSYKVVVGRSRKVEGPYLDREGKDMAYGGGTLVAFNSSRFNASGHNSAYTIDGKDWYLSHAYEREGGASKLILREIKWDEGWPVIDLEEETPKMEIGAVTAGEKTRVNTTYGTIEGYLDGSIYTFKGVPYGKAERFMPPQDPDNIEGVRMCKIYGPKAPQGVNLKWNYESTQRDYSFGNNFVLEPVDEQNCLALNVWTPAINDGKKRPVFVWLHGGGYAGGSGHDLPCYEGYSLAKRGDIVVVTINHRLNILGYIDLSGLGGKWSESVNLGQQDIVKALEWIHKNIEKFGGDPNMVTVGGQSGGGGKVSNLLAMPSAKGLVHRATIQSGSFMGTGNKAESQKLGLAVVEELGLTPETMDKINDFTYEELVEAGNRASRKLAESGRRVGFGPTEDGKFITCQPFGPDAPEISKNVPLLIGTNYNEFSSDLHYDLDRESVIAALKKRMGDEKADAFVAAFEKAYPGINPNDMLYVDTNARGRAYQQAAAKDRQGGAPAYLYLFNWRPKVNTLGANHGMELPFMFNNVHLEREMTGAQPRAFRFQDKVAEAWISFIKTGVPAATGMPEWEAFTSENGATMVLDDACHLEHHFDDDLLFLQ